MAKNPSLDNHLTLASTPGGKPLSQLSTARDFDAKLSSLKRARELTELQWKLNLSFYKGRQYSYLSKASRRIQSLPVDDGDKPRYRVRIVSNQIITGCTSLLSKFLKTKPRMMATPGSGSDSDLRAAQFAEKLLEYWWDDLMLDDTLEEVLLWALIGGQGYWHISWDEKAGKAMTFLVGPDGQPILDETLKDFFLTNLAQQGVQPQEITVYMGDIRVDVISPFDLYVDPTVKKFTDAKFVVHSMYLPPDEIQARWNQSITADAIPSAPDAQMPMGQSDNQERSVARVNTMYIKPHSAVPRGRIVTWGGQNQILEDKAWDLPSNDMPFVKFPGIRIPGEVYDTSVVEQAIPMQKELNRTLSQIVEYKNLSVKPQWFAPAGSLRQRRTDEPGAIFEYNPIAGMQPEPVPVPGIPSYVFEHLQDIQNRLNDVFARTDVTEGSVPPNVEAGVAIDLLQEMAVDMLAPQIRMNEIALGESGELMLALAKKYYVEPRMIKIRGASGSQQVKQFTQADLNGAVSVVVEAGSGLPRTRAGRQSRIEWFIQSGLLTPQQAWRYLDMADMHGIADQFESDEDQAYREHQLLDAGQPISQYQVAQAQQQIQQMFSILQQIYGPPTNEEQGEGYGGAAAEPPEWNNPQAPPNPDTGQPFQSWQDAESWAQQVMHKAAVAPGIVDNHAVHLDVHARVVKSVSFGNLPIEVQQLYIDHINAHREIMFSYPSSVDSVAPRVNLQIKSTVGPTVQSEILKKAGIFTSPEENAEPPNETWVTETVMPGQNTDGTNKDGSQPLPVADEYNPDLLLAAQKAQIAGAQAEQAGAVQQAQAMTQLADSHQKAQHAHDLHHHAMRQAKAKADAAEHQARHAAKPPSKGKG